MSPGEIKKREFSSRVRGFDKDEVRSFLRRISDEVSRLQEIEAEASRRTPAVLAAEAAAQKSGSSDSSFAPPTPPVSARPEAPAAPERPTSRVVDVPSEDTSDSDGSAVLDIDVAAATSPTDDRFEALGERIAGLLRDAHASANSVREKADSDAREILEQSRVAASAMEAEARETSENLKVEAANDSAATRSAAEEEAERIRSEARAMAESSQAEAEQKTLEISQLRVDTETEAAELREQSLRAGETELAEQRAEVERQLAEAQADREQAMAELGSAREQVAELLYQARTQSEFIRHEAEEIIRSKVRQNVEQAESRLAVLRNSEVASRERLSAAQRELTSAMSRLEAEPQPSLPADADDVVLAEAVERGEASGYGAVDALIGTPEPAVPEALSGSDAPVFEASAVETTAFDSSAVEDISIEEVSVDETPIVEDLAIEETDGEETTVVGGPRSFFDARSTEVVEVESEVAETEFADIAETDDVALSEVDELEADADENIEAHVEEASEHVDSDFEPEAIDSELTEFETESSDSALGIDSVGDDVAELSFGDDSDADADAELEVDTDRLMPPMPDMVDAVSSDAPSADGDSVDDVADSTDVSSTLPTRRTSYADSADSSDYADSTDYAEAPAYVSSSTLDESLGSDSVGDDMRVPVAVGADDMSEAPENEDALARLVREAMQRAVDSARSGD